MRGDCVSQHAILVDLTNSSAWKQRIRMESSYLVGVELAESHLCVGSGEGGFGGVKVESKGTKVGDRRPF